MARATALIALAALALNACQTAPPEVVESGALPVTGSPASVAFVRTNGEEALAAAALEEAVRQRLKTWSLVETSPETARYFQFKDHEEWMKIRCQGLTKRVGEDGWDYMKARGVWQDMSKPQYYALYNWELTPDELKNSRVVKLFDRGLMPRVIGAFAPVK